MNPLRPISSTVGCLASLVFFAAMVLAVMAMSAESQAVAGWFFILASIAACVVIGLSVLSTIHEVQHERRLTNRQCPHCGYDLRATPDRCPECGANVNLR